MATLTPKDKNTVTSNLGWQYNTPGVSYNEATYSYNFFGAIIAGIKNVFKNIVTLSPKDKN